MREREVVSNWTSWRDLSIAFLVFIASVTNAHPSTFTTLVNFGQGNGANPAYVSLVQGLDGNLYGTTSTGGTSGGGTVFYINPAGVLTTVFNMNSDSNLSDPQGGVTLAVNGDFYGTTDTRNGTLYSTSGGDHYNFCGLPNCADGSYPVGALVQTNYGDFYGITRVGGSNGAGTVFQFSLSPQSQFGTLTTLYSFCPQSGDCDDGALPLAGLVLAANGSFYGTTYAGGTQSLGTVFKITPQGALATLYSFCSQSICSDGGEPLGGLVEGKDGNLYGTTSFGGANGRTTYGTAYKITPSGALTTIYSFCGQANCTDGRSPHAGLIQGTDGSFYGTTFYGGAHNNRSAYGFGTVFRLTPEGILTTLHRFCEQAGCTDGAYPTGGLVQGTDGNFYGTTNKGGSAGAGTVFKISLGLRPFVKTLLSYGKAGDRVQVLGANLTGATSVAFHGIAAAFTVVSSTQITTSVPTGAASGEVTVALPSGTLFSNVPYRVIP